MSFPCLFYVTELNMWVYDVYNGMFIIILSQNFK